MTDPTRYPSGITGHLPHEPDLDVRAHLAQVLLAIDEQPLGHTATCANPECGRPVDFLPGAPPVLYCSGTCRTTASKLRARATQQLDVLEQLLEDTKHQRGVPRQALRDRAALLRWWLAHLPTAEER